MKYRLYPTKEQKILIAKAFGCSRFSYNWAINQIQTDYHDGKKMPSKFDLNVRMTAFKKENLWLYEVSDWVLKESISDVVKAFDNFFAYRAKFPHYKCKRASRQSARWRNVIHKSKNHIFIPKIGTIRFREHRQLIGKIITGTITLAPSGNYYISFSVDDGMDIPAKPQVVSKAVGIDVGIADFATLSTGEKIRNPHFNSSNLRIKGLQRKLSRQKKGSNRYNRTKQKIAKEHENITNKRKTFLHELSMRLVSENQAIAIESLNVAGMLKNRKLSSSISEVSWSEFFRMLEYKCDWNGVHLMRCNRWTPTSKTCSECGYKMSDMPLNVRHWVCPECGCVHDRDINAAINILSAASVEYGRGGKVRLPLN